MSNWYNRPKGYVSTQCTCTRHKGRELRIWTESPHLDAWLADPQALCNVAVTADRMPFAFTANVGTVFADKVSA